MWQYIASIAIVLLLVFWIFQFAQLMALADKDFPGRYDKVLWVLALLLANVFGAAAFFIWKRLMLAARQIEQEGAARAKSA